MNPADCLLIHKWTNTEITYDTAFCIHPGSVDRQTVHAITPTESERILMMSARKTHIRHT